MVARRVRVTGAGGVDGCEVRRGGEKLGAGDGERRAEVRLRGALKGRLAREGRRPSGERGRSFGLLSPIGALRMLLAARGMKPAGLPLSGVDFGVNLCSLGAHMTRVGGVLPWLAPLGQRQRAMVRDRRGLDGSEAVGISAIACLPGRVVRDEAMRAGCVLLGQLGRLPALNRTWAKPLADVYRRAEGLGPAVRGEGSRLARGTPGRSLPLVLSEATSLGAGLTLMLNACLDAGLGT